MKKNSLSENMLRFGVKNLSESNKRKLTLESVLETIKDYGLEKEVKKALTEQGQQSLAKKIFEQIAAAMQGAGTTESEILKAVKRIDSKATYQELLNMVKEAGYNTVMAWIETDHTKQTRGMVDITGDKKWLQAYSKVLKRWNSNEFMNVAPGNWEI